MLDLRRKLMLHSHSNMSTFPFISLQSSLTVLRVVTPLFFIAHALVRIINDTIPQFANFLGTRGFPQPFAVVWAITVVELVAGTLMIVGVSVRCMAAGIYDDQGKLLAGLSISAPADRLEESWLERVRQTATQISSALGYRG